MNDVTTERQTLVHHVGDIFPDEDYGGLDVPLAQAIKRLSDVLDGIPAECRDSAALSISSEYESDYVTVEVTYQRTESETEMIIRLAEEAAVRTEKAWRKEQSELALLVELQRKYGRS
jgi:hypothetical protein